MEEIIERINKKRKKDINGYITFLVLDLIMWGLLITVSFEKFLTLGIVFGPIALIIGYLLRAELRIYNHPERNHIYRTLSYAGTKEEIDRYVNIQLASLVHENEFFKLSPEILFDKANPFDVHPIKDIQGIIVTPSFPVSERQICMKIAYAGGRDRIVLTRRRATEDNLAEINAIASEMNRRINELKNDQIY